LIRWNTAAATPAAATPAAATPAAATAAAAAAPPPAAAAAPPAAAAAAAPAAINMQSVIQRGATRRGSRHVLVDIIVYTSIHYSIYKYTL